MSLLGRDGRRPQGISARLRVGPVAKLSTQIADRLREQILSGELPPDSRLPAESDLAQELGVSRTAVREAMKILAGLGLVTVRQGHGISVLPPSDDAFAEALTLMLVRSDLTVGDLILARSQIEIEIYSAAADRASNRQLDALAAAVDVFRSAVEDHNWSEAEIAHTNAHLALLAAADLRAFDLLLRPMEQVILLSSRPPEASARLWEVDAHAAIVDAARTRDRAVLREVIAAHYRVMETDDYRAQRASLVRDAPGVRELLVQMLYGGRTPPLTQLMSGNRSARGGDGSRGSQRGRRKEPVRRDR